MKKEDTEKHHLLPKQSQRHAVGSVFDPRTSPIQKALDDEITHQILYEGVPPAYTLSEIDVDDLKKGRCQGSRTSGSADSHP